MRSSVCRADDAEIQLYFDGKFCDAIGDAPVSYLHLLWGPAEDMTIPMFFWGDGFAQGVQMENISLLDIAPTVASLMGVSPEKEWEGRALKTVM